MIREDRDSRAPPPARGTSWGSTEYTPEPAAPKNERLQGWGRDEPAASSAPQKSFRSRGFDDKDDWSVPLPRDDRLERCVLHCPLRL